MLLVLLIWTKCAGLLREEEKSCEHSIDISLPLLLIFYLHIQQLHYHSSEVLFMVIWHI